MAISETARRKIEAFAAQLAAEEGGDLDDALIDEIEDRACEVSDACMQRFTEALLQRRVAKKEVEQDADKPPPCPDCGRPGQHVGTHRRQLLTRRGVVAFDEPECYCRKCRRSFFPSVDSARP